MKSESNLERMIHLAEEFFAAKNDPDQISVTEEVIERLRRIHPATMSEENDAKGPVAWVLLIPTTHDLMELFLAKKISERDLLDRTPLNGQYNCIYLCSALVLPEHRRRGLARRLATQAIASIRKDHPIRTLFYWGFSREGAKLAAAIARECGLTCFARGK